MRYVSINRQDRDYMGLRVLAGTGAVPIVIVGMTLLLVAETSTGRMCAAFVMGVGLLPWLGFTALAKRSKRWTLLVAGLVTLVVLLGGLMLLGASSRSRVSSERASSHYSGGSSGPEWFSPFSLVPEVDQLMFVFTVMPLLDPLLTSSQATELKRQTAAIYREIEADEDFRNLPSGMREAYLDLLGFAGRSEPATPEFRAAGTGTVSERSIRGHSFLYVPAKLDRAKPAPVIVFFHGSGGNFQAYLWILAGLADRLGCVLLAPSNGIGWWEGATSVEAFDRALVLAQETVAVDRTRVDAVGLSNGGLALSRLATARSDKLRSLVFLSPVLDESAIHAAPFIRAWRERQIFILTGETDDRVPLAYVQRNASRLKTSGVNVELRTMPASHFLMFSHRQKVVLDLEFWLKGQR